MKSCSGLSWAIFWLPMELGGLNQQKVEPNFGLTEKNLHFKTHYWTKLTLTL
jgi:hypothetical protein